VQIPVRPRSMYPLHGGVAESQVGQQYQKPAAVRIDLRAGRAAMPAVFKSPSASALSTFAEGIEDDEAPTTAGRSLDTNRTFGMEFAGASVAVAEPNSPMSLGASSEATSPGDALMAERTRLRQISAALRADIQRADQILQEIDPLLWQMTNPGGADAARSAPEAEALRGELQEARRTLTGTIEDIGARVGSPGRAAASANVGTQSSRQSSKEKSPRSKSPRQRRAMTGTTSTRKMTMMATLTAKSRADEEALLLVAVKSAALEVLERALDRMDEAVAERGRTRARTRSCTTWRTSSRPAGLLRNALQATKAAGHGVTRSPAMSRPQSPARSPVHSRANSPHASGRTVRQSAPFGSPSSIELRTARQRRLTMPRGGASGGAFASSPLASHAASRVTSRAVSRATSRGATPSPGTSPRSLSPELEENTMAVARRALRVALEDALAKGLDSSEDFVGRVEASLLEWDNQMHAVRADLKQAVVDWESMNASDTETSFLKEVEDRLEDVIRQARQIGMEERELVDADTLRRKIHNVIEDLKGQVRVYCRVRPLNERERAMGDTEAIRAIDSMTLEVPQGMFHFDGLFTPGDQEEVFDNCADLVQSAVDGHNVTIFAYGQTGAGKTYTMYGNQREEGLAARTITELFRIIEPMNHNFRFRIYASMVEMYNNTLLDLLRPVSKSSVSPKDIPKLSVRYDAAGNVIVDSLCEKVVLDAPELKDLLKRGLSHRTVAANAMNIESSRSHLIFIIKVLSTNRQTGEVLSGKLLLCDLGGSERLKKSESIGHHQKEAIEINRSLTALGDVIEAIATKQKCVPYRNHKLTQIMQDSLGGSAKTLMFVNCSPAWNNLNETMMSLMWASRAKKVTNNGAPASTPALIPPLMLSPGSPCRSPMHSRRGPSNSVLPSPK